MSNGCKRCGKFSWFLFRWGICGACCNTEDRVAPNFGGYDGSIGPIDCEAPMYYWDQSRFALVNGYNVALVHQLFEIN